MLGILNRHRGELGVIALPQELAASGEATKRYPRLAGGVA